MQNTDQAKQHGAEAGSENDSSGNGTCTPHALCSKCKEVFARSEALKKALEIHFTGKELNAEFSANTAKYQQLDLDFKVKRLAEKLERALESSQYLVSRKLDPDGKHAVEEQRITNFLSTLPYMTERLLQHPNVRDLYNSLNQEHCHFCAIIDAIISRTQYLGNDNRSEDTQIWLQFSERPNNVEIEVQLFRDDDLWILERQHRRLQAHIWVSKGRRSGETFFVANGIRLIGRRYNSKSGLAFVEYGKLTENWFRGLLPA